MEITQCPPTDDKICYIHSIKYYSVLKRKEILTVAITWMSLKNIMVSEIKPDKKGKYCMIPFTWSKK
jgi:hypothetical protein